MKGWRDGNEAPQARRDHRRGAAGGCPDSAGQVEAVKTIAVTETTYFRWRAEFEGMKSDQVKRLKELELENARLRRAVSDLTLDKLILTEAARGNF